MLWEQNVYCIECGKMIKDDSLFCSCCGTATMNEQQLDQSAHALYSYCKVMRVPKLGPVPAVITVLEGIVITLVLSLLGMSLWAAAAIGVLISAVFAFLCWLAYRYRVGASKRLNSNLAADGGRRMFTDFASARPFVDDQFRVGRYYLFIRNGAVLRLDSIVDIVRVTSHYKMVPTGMFLGVKVQDENGSMSAPICRLHMLKAGTEIDEIRKALLQRP